MKPSPEARSEMGTKEELVPRPGVESRYGAGKALMGRVGIDSGWSPAVLAVMGS